MTPTRAEVTDSMQLTTTREQRFIAEPIRSHAQLPTGIPPLSRIEMEKRRFEAIDLHKQGMSWGKIGRKFGVSRITTSRWNRAYLAGGADSLKLRHATGRPPKLTPHQTAQLVEILEAGPRASGFEGAYWSGRAARDLIAAVFDVRYDRDHAYRLLVKLGLRDVRTRKNSLVHGAAAGAQS